MAEFNFPILSEKTAKDWKPHPKFPNVVFTEVDYEKDPGWRSLLVKVDAGNALLPHVHENEIEFHFVVAGSGKARRGTDQMVYLPGELHKIPSTTEHEVIAGDDGITIFALFVKES